MLYFVCVFSEHTAVCLDIFSNNSVVKLGRRSKAHDFTSRRAVFDDARDPLNSTLSTQGTVMLNVGTASPGLG